MSKELTNYVVYADEAVKDGKDVKFGCQTLIPQDLGTVEKLLNSEINATITIHGTKINKELLNRLKAL